MTELEEITASTPYFMHQSTFWLNYKFYEVKECLCDIPGTRPRERALALAHDQNVQFLRFLSNYKSRGFILGIHLHLGKTNREHLTVSDDDQNFKIHCT